MRGRWNSIFVCVVFAAAGSMAQETPRDRRRPHVVTPCDPGRKGGHIPEFWGSSTIGDSVITENQNGSESEPRI